jgi:flagellar assembly factor FliW
MSQTASVPLESATRRVVTSMGAFDIADADVIFFSEGLPGFEQCRRFVLISAPELAPLSCLHAIDGPSASFLAVDPRVVLPSYRCRLAEADRARLGPVGDSPLLWLALVTVDAGQGPSVNLRAPIVINPSRMCGFQVMPHDGLYPLRHPLTTE